MNIKALQFSVEFGKVEKNIKKIENLFKQEDLKDTEVVVLPELWSTGYDLENMDVIASDNLEPVKSAIANLAIKYSVHIIAGSIANKVKGGVENTAFVINKEGELVYSYSKMHLVPMLNEPKYLKSGSKSVNTFELDGNKMGLVICYDLRFPELFRDLVMSGAKAICVVAEWPIERTAHWLTLLKARAIENQCYIVGTNVIGTQPTGTTFGGNSIIIDPFGKVVSQNNEEAEGFIKGEIDLEYVDEIRKDIPIFASRRKELYKNL